MTKTTSADSTWSFDQIYDEYKIPIYKYVYHLVGDREQADDLTQDTFLKAFRALPKMDANLKLSAWLYRIATNTAYDALRRRKLIAWLPWQDLDHEPADVESADPQEMYGTTELVRAALRRMPQQYRTALLLYTQEGLSYSEIAKALNIAEGGVKMYLSRARQSFRSHYQALEKGIVSHGEVPRAQPPVAKARSRQLGKPAAQLQPSTSAGSCLSCPENCEQQPGSLSVIPHQLTALREGDESRSDFSWLQAEEIPGIEFPTCSTTCGLQSLPGDDCSSSSLTNSSSFLLTDGRASGNAPALSTHNQDSLLSPEPTPGILRSTGKQALPVDDSPRKEQTMQMELTKTPSLGTLPSFIDEKGRVHTIQCRGGGHPLLVDDVPASIVDVGKECIKFSSATGLFTCPTEALWYAFTGAEIAPTAQEGGMYLAQSIAFWAAQSALIANVREIVQGSLQRALTALEQEPAELLLPGPRLALDVSWMLDHYNGTQESAQSIVSELLARAGQFVRDYDLARPPVPNGTVSSKVADPAGWSDLADLPVPDRAEQPGTGVAFCSEHADESAGQAEKFYWDAESDAELEKAFLASTAPTIEATYQELHQRFGWPKKSIRSRVYYKELHRKKKEQAHTEERGQGSEEQEED